MRACVCSHAWHISSGTRAPGPLGAARVPILWEAPPQPLFQRPVKKLVVFLNKAHALLRFPAFALSLQQGHSVPGSPSPPVLASPPVIASPPVSPPRLRSSPRLRFSPRFQSSPRLCSLLRLRQLASLPLLSSFSLCSSLHARLFALVYFRAHLFSSLRDRLFDCLFAIVFSQWRARLFLRSSLRDGLFSR